VVPQHRHVHVLGAFDLLQCAGAARDGDADRCGLGLLQIGDPVGVPLRLDEKMAEVRRCVQLRVVGMDGDDGLAAVDRAAGNGLPARELRADEAIRFGGVGHGYRFSAKRPLEERMADIAKVITIIGSSPESFAKAADAAVQEAAKTVRGISGADVVSMSATVENDRIMEYRTTVNIAFAVER
jgi:flavin-binding protein dodecin